MLFQLRSLRPSRGTVATQIAPLEQDARKKSAPGAGDRNRTRNLLFTKQLLCQLSYAGVLEKGNGSLLGPGRRGLPLVRDKELLPARARRAGKPLLSLSCR